MGQANYRAPSSSVVGRHASADGLLGAGLRGGRRSCACRSPGEPEPCVLEVAQAFALPVDFLVVQAFDLYMMERHEVLGSGGSDFLLVNLFRQPLGSPVTLAAIGELIETLARRAGLMRRVAPHMCRHAVASNVADVGGSLDEIQALLGQQSPESARPYLPRAAAPAGSRRSDPGPAGAAADSVPPIPRCLTGPRRARMPGSWLGRPRERSPGPAVADRSRPSSARHGSVLGAGYRRVPRSRRP